jgi:hypothetical protein
MTSNSEILALAEHHLGTDNKKGPAFARKSFMIMARPSGFEPETFASGGRRCTVLETGLNRPKIRMINHLPKNLTR